MICSKLDFLLQILTPVLVIILAVAGFYIYSKSCEMEALKTQNQELVEIKGRYEAQQKFIEKEKTSSNTHLSNMNRVLTMLDDHQKLLEDKFVNVEMKEKKCSEHLASLYHDLTSIQHNITALVQQKERAVMQANLYSDKLQTCRNSLVKCEIKEGKQ